MTEKNEIGIINFALSQLSIDPISSMEEKTKIAREMRRFFQIAKESILREFVFDWSHKAEKLVEYGDSEGGYHKPSDYINFIGLGTCADFCCCSGNWRNLANYSHSASLREVNGRLYIQSCCKYEYMHYAYDNLNYSGIPSDLLEIIAFKLAFLASPALTKNQKTQEYIREVLESQLKKTKMHAGMENQVLDSNQCKDARYPLSPFGGFL